MVPRFVVNLIAGALPPTRLFRAKQLLYRAAGVSLGRDVKLNSHCFILGKGRVSIGSRTWVGVGTRFFVPEAATIEIGVNCDIAPDVRFLCGTHALGDSSRRAGEGRVGNIRVGSGVWIGCGAILLPGVEIGDGSLIAAGAVVLPGRYPDNVLIAGNPGVVKKMYDCE